VVEVSERIDHHLSLAFYFSPLSLYHDPTHSRSSLSTSLTGSSPASSVMTSMVSAIARKREIVDNRREKKNDL